MADIILAGSTSGSITVSSPAVSGSNTLTLPAVTDTLVGLAATQTLTNKSIVATQLTGTVAVANGGTGGSTSTGTGAVVLATSPSLTSPALGTPASGALTNCTSIPGAQITGTVTGTLTAGTSLVKSPLAVSTTTTQSHGLGGNPSFLHAYFECLTTEYGYAVGARVPYKNMEGSSGNRGISLAFDTTNTYLVICTAFPGFLNISTTGGPVYPTAANWKFVIVPYKLN